MANVSHKIYKNNVKR